MLSNFNMQLKWSDQEMVFPNFNSSIFVNLWDIVASVSCSSAHRSVFYLLLHLMWFKVQGCFLSTDFPAVILVTVAFLWSSVATAMVCPFWPLSLDINKLLLSTQSIGLWAPDCTVTGQFDLRMKKINLTEAYYCLNVFCLKKVEFGLSNLVHLWGDQIEY